MRSHLFTKKLFYIVCGLDVQVIFSLLCNKLCTDMQNWNKSCNNLGKGGDVGRLGTALFSEKNDNFPRMKQLQGML